MKEVGGEPTAKKPDGSDYYTLPAIYDPKTGRVVTDSKKIAEYLDETYPNTPPLFPPGLKAAIALQNSVFVRALSPIFPPLIQAAYPAVNEVSQSFFRRTREAIFGKKFEEISPPSTHDTAWATFKINLEDLSKAYAENGPGSKFFVGNTFTYADVVVASFLLWVKLVEGEGSAQWKEFGTWNDGLWVKLLDVTEKWQRV